MHWLELLIFLTIFMFMVLVYDYWIGSVSIMVVQGVENWDTLVITHWLREEGRGEMFLLNSSGLYHCEWRVVLIVILVIIVILILLVFLILLIVVLLLLIGGDLERQKWEIIGS